MSGKVVLLAPDDGELDAFQGVAPEGVEITWVDSTLPLEQQAAQLRETVAIIPGRGELSLELARACPNLKLIQGIGAGTDRMDIHGLGELAVRVANNHGGNSAAVSELAIALMITAYRKLHLQYESTRAGNWNSDVLSGWSPLAHDLTDKTVGIIGLGHIGKQVAKRLQGWECDLLYNDIIEMSPEVEQELQVTRVGRDELLRASDVVTLHVPLDRVTRGMISDREFDMMKPTAILVNACRGPVVDEAALIRALRQDKIAGCGLDVLEQEPTPADNPLLAMDNVCVTPHTASWTQGARVRNRTFAMANVARVLRGEEPISIVLPV